MKTFFVRNFYILLGSSFIVGVLLASCINGVFFDGEIKQTQAIYVDAYPVDKAPFEPAHSFWLGTDTNGRHLLHVIIEGAKYTIGLGLFIAIFRMFFSFVLGTIYALYLQKYQRVLSALSNAFQYIPVVLLAYFLLSPVLNQAFEGFQYSFATRVWYEIILLVLLALPTVSLVIGNEISIILRKEFIQSAKTLGASSFFILRKHVIVHIYRRLLIIFTQQVIQVLLILAHLGLFELYLGGTKIDYSIMKAAPITTTYEWSGLIGDYFDLFIVYPWIPLVPIGAFTLAILSLNLIVKGLEKNMDPELAPQTKRLKQTEIKEGRRKEFSFQVVTRD
ncbi:peptide/nickel transport system permease protein [Fictibacillus halophilus]|uniref:Peptide/nickel transport system permease protein n=1 Tax=Fictibacillus halophilus TaxID=1610490 RepID=A0ABV2LMP9_9BACL